MGNSFPLSPSKRSDRYRRKDRIRFKNEFDEDEYDEGKGLPVEGGVEKRGRFRSRSWIANEHFLACNPSYLMSFLDVRELSRMEQVRFFLFTIIFRTHINSPTR
jgi:hypothetical protein